MRDFDEFASAATRPLLRLGWLLSGSAEQAQDLAQTALIRTYGAWHRVRDDDALAYARRVLVNLHTDWLRRRPWREQPHATLPEQVAADRGTKLSDTCTGAHAQRRTCEGAPPGLGRRPC